MGCCCRKGRSDTGMLLRIAVQRKPVITSIHFMLVLQHRWLLPVLNDVFRKKTKMKSNKKDTMMNRHCLWGKAKGTEIV